MKKKCKFWFKLSQTYSSSTSFKYLEEFFLKIPKFKKNFIYERTTPVGGGKYCPHTYKIYTLSYCYK